MRRKHAFLPSASDLLERRVVLSRTAQGTPVIVGGLYPQQRVLNRHQQSVAAQINQAFDSFENTYDQARATYFTSIQNQANPSPATTNAFVVDTTQQVSLIGQQVLNIFVQTKRTPRQSNSLKRLVAAKIVGAQAQINPGSLAQALLQSIPQPGTTAPTSSLYSLGQDAAIESARVAILNGVNHL
jgi:hypothetical protein